MDLTSLNPVELVDRFREKAQSWWATYQGWQQQSAKFAGTPLAAKYNALMSDGAAVRAGIETATKAIDSIAGLIQQAREYLGLNGVGAVGGLGILPFVIPVAIITTVTLSWRAIDAWMANAQRLEAEARASIAASVQAAGGSAAQVVAAATYAPGAPDKPILEQAKSVIIWAAIAFALYKLLPIAIDKFGKRGSA